MKSKLFLLNDKEFNILWWGMLVIMIIYLSYGLYNLSQEGVYEWCVKEDNESITCFKERSEAEAYAGESSYPKDLDYKYINNLSLIEDKVFLNESP